VVLSHARLHGDHTDDAPGAAAHDTDVRTYLVGFRHTPWHFRHFTPFVQGLLGTVSTEEKDKVTGRKVLDTWGPAWAITGGLDWEIPGLEEVRLRVQYDTILHRVGQDVRFGHGWSALISIGWEHPH
jgi:hypothetical protein